MLYDKRWDKTEAETDPFTLESLIAWLEKQNPTEEYNWEDIEGCVICQYLHSLGYPFPSSYPGFGPTTIKNWGANDYSNICMTLPWTFGDALERARSALTS